MKQIYYLNHLGCANCGAKIENKVQKMEGVKKAVLDFTKTRMVVDQTSEEDLTVAIQEICDSVEAGIFVSKEKNIEKEEESPGEELKGTLLELFLVALAVVGIRIFVSKETLAMAFYGVLLIYVGFSVYRESLSKIRTGDFFDENFLMSIASFGAFFVGEYLEALAVMIFYRIGEALQDMAVERSKKSIANLLETDQSYAHVWRNENWMEVEPDELQVGDKILIKPGENVPIDGMVQKGESLINNQAITGESRPVEIGVGERILAGSIAVDGTLEILVEKSRENSTMAKIQEMVDQSTMEKAKVERWITRFARIYTPIVVGIAAVIGFLIPIFLQLEFSPWIYRACTFLIISCPCALVLSVPLSMYAGIGRASKEGIFIRGGDRMELMAEMDGIAFDKTGTLTDGKFYIDEIRCLTGTEEALFSAAKSGEIFSNHPIGKAIMEYPLGEAYNVESHKDFAGKGIVAETSQGRILVGNEKILEEFSIENSLEKSQKTRVLVVQGETLLGEILLSDRIKWGVEKSLVWLRKNKISTFLYSGDNDALVQDFAKKIPIDKAYGGLMPEEKLFHLEEELSKGKHLAYIGDGINDAPVLARADVGIAMGTQGSDMAISSSDIILLQDDIGKIPTLISLAKETKKVTYGNIYFALGAKILIMILSLLGITSLWLAVFADVGVALLAVAYATSLLRWKTPSL